jgi:hypothetical protein
MTKKEVALHEVDGTIPGRAALVVVNLDDIESRNGLMQTLYVEGEGGCDDPQLWAEGLRESTKDDWPEHTFTIVLNERARYLMAARRTRDMGFGEYTPKDHVER